MQDFAVIEKNTRITPKEEFENLKAEKLSITNELSQLKSKWTPGFYEKSAPLKKRLGEIEVDILRLRKIVKGNNESNSNGYLKAILKEALSTDRYQDVLEELSRRIAGAEPRKVLIEFQQPQYNVNSDLKKRYLVLVDQLENARKELTRYITQNEPEINKAVWLTAISPLNRTLPSLTDLSKLRRTI